MMTSRISAADYNPLAFDSSDEVKTLLDLKFEDSARKRSLQVLVYLPKDTKPAPVVLFRHGLGGSREGSAFLGRHWAARGYVAVFLQYPGSDDSIWRDKPAAERMAAWQQAANVANFQLRVKGVPAVIDQLETWNKQTGHALSGRLDLAYLGMSGHFFEAITTEAVSGQTVAPGANLTYKRINAAIVFRPKGNCIEIREREVDVASTPARFSTVRMLHE